MVETGYEDYSQAKLMANAMLFDEDTEVWD
jgi:hypothetical protein